jgi:hypothetical protein
MSARKKLVLWTGGILVLGAAVLEVLHFGVDAFLSTLWVWLLLVGSAAVVTPRRGPEDELWFTGIVRELTYRRRGRGGGEGGPPERDHPAPEPAPPGGAGLSRPARVRRAIEEVEQEEARRRERRGRRW